MHAALDIAPGLVPIPRKPGLPLLGNLTQVPKGKLIQFLTETSRSFDGLFALDLAGREVAFASTAALVAELCDERRFRKSLGPGVTMLRALAGDGLFTAHSDEPNWGKAHRILMPAFGQRAMRGYFDAMLAVGQRLVCKWRGQGPDADIAVADDMTRLTLDTIALCGFGFDFGSFNDARLHPFIEAMVRSLGEALGRITRLPVQTALMRGTQRQFAADNHFMNELVDRVIAQRRQSPTDGGDLLNLMLQARDPESGEALDDLNIRYQVLTFLVAGHETTSGLLSFALYELVRHPGVMAQAYAEVDAVLPGDKVPAYADMARLTVIDRVLKETLRLWPTAPAFSVAPFEDTVIGGRYRIHKDQRVTVLTTALHRDPASWPHAERFDIDRFLPEAEAAMNPQAYKPFGNGQRACIGRQFALTEAKLALALILQNFKLDDPHDYRFRIAEALTIKPEGLVLRASPRAPHERLRPDLRSDALNLGSVNHADASGDAGPLPAGQGRVMQVAYGSSLGCARETAEQIAQRASAAGFEAVVLPLDALVSALPEEGLLVIVAATYNGQPPDSARRFDAALDSQWADIRRPRLQVALLGCGNSQWPTYQAFPRRIAAFFERCGAQWLLPRGEADANADFDRMAGDWLAALWRSVDADGTGASTGLRPPVRVIDADPLAARRPVLPAGVMRLEVLSNSTLVRDPTGLWDFGLEAPRSDTRHLWLRLPAGAAQPGYQTGDHLAVYPSNDAALVNSLIERLSLNAQARIRLQPQRNLPAGLPLDMPLTVQELLTHYLELQDLPSRAVLAFLQQATRCPFTQRQLAALTSDAPDTGYAAQIAAARLTLPALLQRFPAIELSLEGLLTVCAPIRPRLYSIASAPAERPGELAITVGTVRGPALSGPGEFRGVASNHLAGLEPGQSIWASVRTPDPVFAPEAGRPMILIGPGTGIAPFRGFVMQRRMERAQGLAIPPTLLFHGCRHPEHDWLYRDEMQSWQQQGLVSLRLAVSTQQPGQQSGARFVQHALALAADEVWAWWDQGAVIYVCGDGRYMAPAVRDTLIAMHRERYGSDLSSASDWLLAQMAAGRYRQDVFN